MAKHSGVPFIFVNVSDGNEKAFFFDRNTFESNIEIKLLYTFEIKVQFQFQGFVCKSLVLWDVQNLTGTVSSETLKLYNNLKYHQLKLLFSTYISLGRQPISHRKTKSSIIPVLHFLWLLPISQFFFVVTVNKNIFKKIQFCVFGFFARK